MNAGCVSRGPLRLAEVPPPRSRRLRPPRRARPRGPRPRDPGARRPRRCIRLLGEQEAETIGRANLDGTGVNQRFIPQRHPPGRWRSTAEHIYWVNSTTRLDRACRSRRSECRAEIHRTRNPQRGVAVDANYIYWARSRSEGTIGRADTSTGLRSVDTNFITQASASPTGWRSTAATSIGRTASDTIGRASLDGSGPVNLRLHRQPPSPRGGGRLGLRLLGEPAARGTIGRRANLDGSESRPELHQRRQRPPSGMAVDGGHVYWANVGNNTIGRANLDGSGIRPELHHLSSTRPRSGRGRRGAATCAGQEATIVGTGRSDKLRGTNGEDVIAAGGGDDTVGGLGGDDVVCGGGRG